MRCFYLIAIFVSFTLAQQNTTAPTAVPANQTAPVAITPAPKNGTADPTAAPLPQGQAPPDAKQPTPAAPKQPAGASIAGNCPRACVRKEFRSLSDQERGAYLRAVRQLMNTPARTGASLTPANAAPKAPTEGLLPEDAPALGRLWRRQQPQQPAPQQPASAPLNGPSEYDRLVKIHIDAQSYAHGNSYFLPWHRAYLAEYERALQSVDPTVCLPYWQWSMDSQAPEESVILSADYFGGNGQGADNCVQDGHFAGYRPFYPEPHCLSRQYSDGAQIGAFQSIEAVNRAVATIRDYNQFRRHVEGVIHPSPHVNLGGDMSTMASPADPIFWMHHAYVDHMWATWQRRNGFAFDQDATQTFEGLPTYRASDVLDSRQLCYQYADLQDQDLGDLNVVPNRPAPPRTPAPAPPKDKLPELTKVIPLPKEDDETRFSPKDRSNLVILRYVQPLNEEWCRRNGINYEENRKYEDDYRNMVKHLNEIKGYVSPCALLKRPKLCAGLVRKRRVEKFYVDVESVGRVEVSYHASIAEQDPYKAIENVNQRVYQCSPSVERPAEEFRAEVQKLTGPSAFEGAGSLRQITDIDQLRGSAEGASRASSAVLAMVAAVAGWNVLA